MAIRSVRLNKLRIRPWLTVLANNSSLKDPWLVNFLMVLVVGVVGWCAFTLDVVIPFATLSESINFKK